MISVNNKYILIISAVFPPEPVVSAKLSKNLYEALKEAGYLTKVIHPIPTRPLGFSPEPKTQDDLDLDEITVDSYVCPQSSLFGRTRESYSLGKACKRYIVENKENISCIYANTWALFSQRDIVRVAKKYNIPSVIHVQDVYPESLTNKISGFVGKLVNSILLPIDKFILRNCTHVIAISDKMKTYLSKTRNIKEKKIDVVINWQDEQDFLEYQKQAVSEELHPFTFMYMGNIGPVAGVDLLIEAFANTGLDNARLVIAGSGSMKEKLKELAEPYKNIEFWDVPNGKVPEIQAKADCMLLPIKKGAASSSIPSKLPAYMFSAKPIIGCMDADSDTAKAIMESGGGWLIEPENAPKLADTMKRVVGMSEDLLKTMGNNAQEYGLEHFSKKKNLDKLTKVIIDCIKD